MGKPLDLVGKRFGRLTVVSRIGMNEKRCVLWKCKCDCGKEIMLPTKHLRSQNVISCGCNRIEKKQREFIKNSMFRKTRSNKWNQSVKALSIEATKKQRVRRPRSFSVTKWNISGLCIFSEKTLQRRCFSRFRICKDCGRRIKKVNSSDS